jgi:hypothetical protein
MSLCQTPDPIRIKSLTPVFSSFEGGNGFLCDWDDSSGTGVTPLARSPELSRKRSETSQLHSVSATQSFYNFVQYGVDNFSMSRSYRCGF